MSEPVILEVAEAPKSDVGLGRARIDAKTRVALGVDVGETIQVRGKRSTAVKLFRVMPDDEGKGIIRIDGLVRRNVAAAVGEKVEVCKADPLPAEHLAFAPIISEGHKIAFGQGIENYVKRGLLRRPLNKGDVVIVPGIALMGGALPFMVISTSPQGIVQIQEGTIIELKEEPMHEAETMTPEELWKNHLIRLLGAIEATGADLDRLEGTAKEKATNLRDRLMEPLRAMGLQEMTANPGDAFDSTIHETIGAAIDDRIAEGRIKSIVRNGFRLGEIILRRTQVIVVGNSRGQEEELTGMREEVRRLRSQVRRLANPAAEAPLSEVKRMKVKVVMVGDRDVDKSSLIRRFVLDVYDDKSIQTVGSKVSKTLFSVPNPVAPGDVAVEMTIWDVVGQKGSIELVREAYFYGARGVLAVCDVTRQETLRNLDDWIESVYSVTGKIPVVFLANDPGLGGRSQITEEVLNAVAKTYNGMWFSTSSKTGDNVQRAFQALAGQIARDRFSDAFSVNDSSGL